MPLAGVLEVGMGKSVATPSVVMRPILLTGVAVSVNHSAPSGPAAMLPGKAPFVAAWNSVKVSASACSAPPATAHKKAIITSGDRRYRFHMCSPLDTQREGLRQMSHPTKKHSQLRPTS